MNIGRERMGIEELRPGQAEAFEHILKKRDVLAVMPTGSGKSLLYQLPSLVLPGVTVVVSPLIALIKDQIDKMEALGVAVCRADSTLTTRQKRAMEKLMLAPGGKLLLTTPERMAVPEFRTFLRECAGDVGVSMFVVDEAHCVSQWGHDFRPSYLVMRQALEDLGRPPVLATTATAPPHVRDDILFQLGMPKAKLVTTSFDRPNLHYECIALPDGDDKTKTLVTLLKKLPRPGIVYCATVRMVEQLHEKLGRHNIPVARYHGRLTKKIRTEEQLKFMAPKSSLVMIATNAFGLGVDKRDIRYVLHYHVPGSLEAYAQEAGRGGRDDKPARCVLLFSPDDVAIQEFFLKGTYPTRRQVRFVYRTLEQWDYDNEDGAKANISNIALGARVGKQRTRTILSLFKDEHFVVESEDNTFRIADPPPDPSILRDKARQYEARRIADRQRLDALLAYVGTSGCRSQIILSYLGEVDPPVCGRCDNCLRSKEAALAASRNALLLEETVTRQLDEEWGEDDRPKRRVITRVIRIDKEPSDRDTAQKTADGTRTPNKTPRFRPKRRGEAEVTDPTDEIAKLVASQSADDNHEVAAEAYDQPEDAAQPHDDDDEYEYEDVDDDEEEDDEYEYFVEEIDKTAAALAEEGLEPEMSEITILARKKQPKPPRKRGVKAAEADEQPTKKRRRRRRRRKKSTLPPKSAFISPVLSRNNAPATASTNSAAASGPVIEYVRGPMRINMTPVASATPNDAPPKRKTKKRRRRKPGAAGTGTSQQHRTAAAASGSKRGADGSNGASEAGSGKRRRRRRRRRKKPGAGVTIAAAKAQGVTIPEGPVSFFAVQGGGSNGSSARSGNRKRRRRRRRRGKGTGDKTASGQPGDNAASGQPGDNAASGQPRDNAASGQPDGGNPG